MVSLLGVGEGWHVLLGGNQINMVQTLAFQCADKSGLMIRLTTVGPRSALVSAKDAVGGKIRIHDILLYLCAAGVELEEGLAICAESLPFGAIVTRGARCHERAVTNSVLKVNLPHLLKS